MSAKMAFGSSLLHIVTFPPSLPPPLPPPSLPPGGPLGHRMGSLELSEIVEVRCNASFPPSLPPSSPSHKIFRLSLPPFPPSLRGARSPPSRMTCHLSGFMLNPSFPLSLPPSLPPSLSPHPGGHPGPAFVFFSQERDPSSVGHRAAGRGRG